MLWVVSVVVKTVVMVEVTMFSSLFSKTLVTGKLPEGVASGKTPAVLFAFSKKEVTVIVLV